MIFTLLFWGSVFLIVYAYAGYPCALAALARVTDRRVRKRRITPRATLIITAMPRRDGLTRNRKLESATFERACRKRRAFLLGENYGT